MSNTPGKQGPIYHLPPFGEPPPLSVQFIGVNYCEPHYRNVRTLARITVIGYVLAGQGRVQAGPLSGIARRGDIFILPAGCRHEVTADPDHSDTWSYIWLNISGSWILNMLEAYKLLDHITVQDSGLEPVFQDAIESAKTLTIEDMQSYIQIVLMRIVVSLSESLRGRGDTLTPTVRAIKQFLDNHILHPFDSGKLADHIGLSYKQMNRLFKQEAGTTLYNYVINKKIESAKLMLLDTQLTVSDIGYKLGYDDPHYFSNLFHSKAGVRPSEFRKLLGRTE
ncbi:helix-turn-helix domain-containing protein [Paenibacillus sp. GCM10023248]|uniref:AraC family transcriptional regulator n=1 Tax=Bacillales TaxID=1385 RepID=UPI00237917F1|nr:MULTISPECIES: AraC family transcriptional regulator [Bacillales]MDD9269094.1 AraC family transcriptional regulator [Paenibacillus sp. MAHUQ-63]MDR6880685.1 AraC-like DNA-binding protein [Bacillus sp. 3255]